MDFGIICGSFKPLHAGHYKLIQKASQENDAVILIVSLTDRIRKDEYPIYGKNMALVWRDHILEILPENVKPIFLTTSPVKRVFEILGHAENMNSVQANQYRIYGDEKELQQYQQHILQQYYPNLTSSQTISTIPVEREIFANISGASMRSFLQNKNHEDFCRNLPPDLDGMAIYNILSPQQ